MEIEVRKLLSKYEEKENVINCIIYLLKKKENALLYYGIYLKDNSKNHSRDRLIWNAYKLLGRDLDKEYPEE